MYPVYEDRFVVYAQRYHPESCPPRVVEREVVACATYEEALAVRRRCREEGRTCVIRFEGSSGGGD